MAKWVSLYLFLGGSKEFSLPLSFFKVSLFLLRPCWKLTGRIIPELKTPCLFRAGYPVEQEPGNYLSGCVGIKESYFLTETIYQI